MKSICVFCGSSSGKNPGIQNHASELGRIMAKKDYKLIYGGASIGLMGVLANSALDLGAHVVGVIPKALERREITHQRLTETYLVESMHDRKARMADLADAFIAMPGGLGTLEEFFEILTWAQLGLHQKPIGLLNSFGYFDGLLEFMDRGVKEGFLWSEHRDIWHVADQPATLIEKLETAKVPHVDRWLYWNQT